VGQQKGDIMTMMAIMAIMTIMNNTMTLSGEVEQSHDTFS
jgi:hypothetical protein